MTCIVAIKRGGRTIVGCDSLISTGDYKSGNICKIYEFPGALVAFSGIMTMSHVLEEMSQSKRVKKYFSIASVEDARNFAKRVYRSLREDFSHTNNDNLVSEPNFILIATKNAIYQVDVGLSCLMADKYASIGSGQDPAKAIMWALWDIEKNPEVLATKALEGACHFNLYCDKPLFIMEVKDPPPKKPKPKKLVKKEVKLD